MPDTAPLLGVTVRPQLPLEAALSFMSLEKTRDICMYPYFEEPCSRGLLEEITDG